MYAATVILLLGIFFACHLCQDLYVGLNTVQLIEKYGYPSETHHVITEDGYNITVHRIPQGVTEHPGKRPAVLLMHGLMANSANFVNVGPGRSLGYILADAGYDVWLGNARGSEFSRQHLTLDPINDAEKFWDHSWHEIGYYDIAAMIDHILAINGDQSLYYIGHSQGTTDFLVLASSRPEYNSKIKIASLMAPAAIMTHQTHGIIGALLPYLQEIEAVSRAVGLYDFPFTEAIREWASANCGKPEFLELCLDVVHTIGGAPDDAQFNLDLMPVMFSNTPSGGSLKQYFHYGQLILSGKFARYDYGPDKNLELYGSEEPASYDLAKVTTPVAIFYGKNDAIVIDADVEELIPKLPNVVNVDLIPHDLFNHLDFVYANDVVSLVYNDLLAIMEQY